MWFNMHLCHVHVASTAAVVVHGLTHDQPTLCLTADLPLTHCSQVWQRRALASSKTGENA